MDILILGALPHHLMAKESEAYLEKQAPFLTHLLQTHQAQTEWFDIETLGCTPYEYYQLKQVAYHSQDGFYARGLAPLRCPAHFNTALPKNLYLMTLCHIEVGLNHASLYLQEELNIPAHESTALFEQAKTLFENTPFSLLSYDADTALIDLGNDFDYPLPSPALLATGYINDWYRPQILPRTLQNSLNELQMSWYDHPINVARQSRGEKAINSAWIYGGASKADIKTISPTTHDSITLDTLFFSHLHQDWGSWLAQLNNIDQQLKSLHSAQNRYIFFGFDRITTLTPLPWWHKFLTRKDQWKQWWSLSK
ncbi:hypothetical protein F9B74_05315 [Pelistega sp. NLN82]|uniref:Cofactor-independent phosphoglycerate mutase n=1 Tax=Pelistega ratti TaxID=2652177 RepID=A0A6L9Y663_9BURK|nr:hypothetical protein [Pelistega ratti]NEN75746.1 hypothetical protein [Pelistega ratti]